MSEIKVELYNGSNRQIWIDVKGKNAPEDIFPVGLQQTIILDIETDQIERIKSTLPSSVLFQY
jgi:hypothetical protein